MKKILLVLISVVMLLTACGSDNQPKNSAVIWIGGVQTRDCAAFEIMTDKTVIFHKGDIGLDFQKQELVLRRANNETLTLNSEANTAVNKAISSIGEKKADSPGFGSGKAEIYAYINKKWYWTLYDEKDMNNKKLKELTDLLFEQFGGTYESATEKAINK